MKEKQNNIPLTYEDAGVGLDRGYEIVDRIKPLAKSTYRKGVLANIGGFGGLFELPQAKYSQPVLVSSTDGVGTKLKLALAYDKIEGLGIDLVAMCVNDILACGAEPLFFLDYYACSHLNVDQAERLIASIAEGCKQANCALSGGETAEMPGMYAAGDFDVAGFSVGIVDKENIIDGSKVVAGDALLGIASSGPHSNGFSLIRKVVERVRDRGEEIDDEIIDQLLAPTRIYVRSMLSLFPSEAIKAVAHITGGSFRENIPRMLSNELGATIDTRAWTRPTIFNWIQRNGDIEENEMLNTFNCGIGYVLVIAKHKSKNVINALRSNGEKVFEIGEIVHRENISSNDGIDLT